MTCQTHEPSSPISRIVFERDQTFCGKDVSDSLNALTSVADVLRNLRYRRRLVCPPENLPSSTALADGIRDALTGPDNEPVDLEDTHGESGPDVFRTDCRRHGPNLN
jgi:hypothetical protein